MREVCQAGLLEFELRARAAIAHTLARRNVFAHTSTSHLDAGECAKPGGPTRATKFEQWERTYLDAIGLAASEDFIAHLLMKYGHPLPIWATVDVLSFGNLPYLFELMLREDRIEVARAFGVKQDRRFGAWLRSMVDFRNYCAHGARLFNRHFKRDISVVQGAIDPALLGHVIGTDFSASDAPQSRLYVNAALLAYMLRRHSSGSTWHRSFRTQARKLPVSGATGGISLTAERDMGFPADWESEQLWQ